MSSRLIYFLSQPKSILVGLLYRFGGHLSDKTYIKFLFPLKTGYKLKLNNPKTFAEKCQWLKLYDHNPIYSKMVDKYDAKQLVADKIGDEYVIPTYGIWDKVEDIDWDMLPNKFVIKPTHIGGGTGVIICKNKKELNIEESKQILSLALGEKIYPKFREWQYKDVRPRIIAEALLEDNTCPYLRDYKFYCFNGKAKLFYITSNKGISETRQDFFDINGNHLDLEDINYPNNKVETPRLPNRLADMVKLSEILSSGIPHVRIDLYEVEDKIYFGEWTFFEGAGFAKFSPEQWNYTMGDWICLPKSDIKKQ